MDKNEKLLSFIVPVYNIEEYLEECLDSLVSQDISYEEYEIICVDDGSTDKSGEILDSYAERYANIVVVHKENGGVSSARNCGIDIAKGQYIWFVDADDFIKVNCLSVIKSILLDSETDIIRILAYAFNDKETENILNNITPDMSQEEIKSFLWTKILRREYITVNKIYFDTRIAYAEDAVFMLQLSPFLQNVKRVDNTVLYFYRHRPGSAMSYNLNKKIISRTNGALVCEEIIQGKRIGDIEGAYKFKYMSVVKIIGMAMNLPKSERHEIVKGLRNKKLFPLKYSSKYTPNFRKNKVSFIKRIRNILTDFSYTRTGYFVLCGFVNIIDLLKRFNR